MTERPGFWMNESSGALQPAVIAYIEGKELHAEQIALIRAYLRQWIMVGNWKGNDIAGLRLQVNAIVSKADIDAWLTRALDSNIDPF